MSESPASSSDFYIGWQNEAPSVYARRVQYFVLSLAVLIPLIGALLVLNQSGFATSAFELGKPTTLKGQLLTTPAPFLRVRLGRGAYGEDIFQDILLVSFGKFGASETIRRYEKAHNISLEGKTVTLEGTLIYHDGKTVMELTRREAAFLQAGHEAGPPAPPAADLGKVAIVGEISDPKCLLGVMKPGWGKPHRSCAARCIAGGIAPVVRSEDSQGRTSYYLLLGPDGEPVNQQILSQVGKPVLLCGRLERRNDWLALYVDPGTGIQPVPERFKPGSLPMCRN